VIWTYSGDGLREPLDLKTLAIDGCCLCGHPTRNIGLFVPSNDEMIAVVLKLRRHPMRPNSTPCLAYGLCALCGDLADVFERVERRLEAAARRVVVQ
jgi:hypothetical protein